MVPDGPECVIRIQLHDKQLPIVAGVQHQSRHPRPAITAVAEDGEAVGGRILRQASHCLTPGGGNQDRQRQSGEDIHGAAL